ncbi:MAG: hypothetical protein AAF497_06385, partial [Planctomycetota bacterium]
MGLALDNIVVDAADSGGGATQATLDLEGPPAVPSGTFIYPTSYDEDGFHLRLADDSGINRTGDANSNRPSNGTAFISILFGGILEITKNDGSLFDAESVDIAEYSTVFSSPQQITWTGHRPNGSTVTHTFVTDGVIDGVNGQDDFQTFNFPASFTGLNRMTIEEVVAIDNLVFSENDGVIQTGTLQITSTGTTDTEATLYDSSFNVITSDNDSGTGSNFLINQADFYIGTYYLRVVESGSNATGPYNILLGWEQVIPAPDTPTGFTVTNDRSDGVQLNWDSVSGATTYSVYRHTADDFGNATQLATGVTATNYLDATSLAGTNYFFWVTAANSGGESPAGTAAQGLRVHPGPTITAQPASVAVNSGQTTTLTVAATTTVGSLSYQWYEGPAGTMTTPVGSNSPNYTTPAITIERQFWVRVSNGLNHTDSSGATVSVLVDPPTLVSAFRGFSTSVITVRWKTVSGPLGRFLIYRNTTNDSGSATLIGNSTSQTFEDTTAVSGQNYYYFVRSENTAGVAGAISGGTDNEGSLAPSPVGSGLIPISGINDIAYSPDGSKIYVSESSGWIDQIDVATGELTNWSAVGEPILGIDTDSAGTEVYVAAAGVNNSQMRVYKTSFLSTHPTAQAAGSAPTTGETGFFDVFRVSNTKVLVSAQRVDGTVPLRDFNPSALTLTQRNDAPTADNRIATRTFFVGSAAPYSDSGGVVNLTYHTDFDGGFGDFTSGSLGSGSVSHVGGEVQLNPGNGSGNHAWIYARASDLIPEFDPKLANNLGEITWAWTMRNQDGGFNNVFRFDQSAMTDPFASSNFGYSLGGGGYVGDRMLFARQASASSPYGSVYDILLDETNGMPTNTEGAFRVTFDPSRGTWRVYFEQGATPPDPMLITNQIGTFSNQAFASVDLPYVTFSSATTGQTWVDNFTLAINSLDNLSATGTPRSRIHIVQGEPAAAGWFDYLAATNSFGPENADPQVSRFAATTNQGNFTAIANGTSTTVYSANGTQVTTLPYSGGLGFSPRARQLFVADAASDQIRVFSTIDWSEFTQMAIPGGLAASTGPFGQGNLKVRPDGLELALICEDGLRFFDIGQISTGDRPEISAPSPSTLVGAPGGPNEVLSSTFNLTNPSTNPMNWAAETDVPWLTFLPDRGTLAPGSQVVVTAQVNANANSLPVGTFAAEITAADEVTGLLRKQNLELLIDNVGDLPIYEDFEDELELFWVEESDGPGRGIRITTGAPYSGSFHYIMDATSPPTNARNELTLKLNLSNSTGVELQFKAKEFDDEPHSTSSTFTDHADFDGVAISEDGTNWHVIQPLTNLNLTWQTFVIDLDQQVANLGLSYGPIFYIRFNQFDNLGIPADGIAFDNI